MSDNALDPVSEPRRMGVPLTLAIFVLPVVFAWFLLRRGYSSSSRVGAFAYMILNIAIGVRHHVH